ncbi:hypothetical protein CASFOL_029938 [Castilleja foliolosa]|uniref:Agenet domain-containing protein n=1 Tax=Castilleja foliolosa TaxID=1961234 RepID=A0ABD3CAI9_9LAMI
MGKEANLPFKAGQKAESRSFMLGYRGAWFRSEILKIYSSSVDNGRILLQYCDYPDDTKPRLLKLYHVSPFGTGKEKYRELMLRPSYPPVYKANQMPHASVISEVSVIVDDTWKVGDLVDWMTEGCYWSGSITKLYGGGKAEMELTKPPHGEGGIYDIDLVDVRPSLDWSPEYGWTMPTQEGECGRPCAWLLKPINQQNSADFRAIADADNLLQITDTRNSSQEIESGDLKDGTSLGLPSSTSVASEEVKSIEPTETSKRSKTPTKSENKHKKSTRRRHRVVKTDSVQTVSEQKADVAADVDDINSDCSTKKYIDNGGSTVLNSTRSDTLEAAVLDLEEYVNKVKWLKTILGCGISSSDGSTKNQWEFVEPRAASGTPK